MSSICKDLRLHPRVHSCFTCLVWVSFFVQFQTARLLTTDGFLFFFLLWTVILNWRSSMREFVSFFCTRLCLIVFKTFCDRSGIRTRAHTRVPEFSTVEFLRPGALDCSAILPGFRQHFFFDLWTFHWVNFSIQRCYLLSGLCHPFVKICVYTHAYIRVSHVLSGYLFLFSFKPLAC